MNIKKIGRRFFYLQTTGNDSLNVTAGLSSLQAFIILGVFAIIKKIFFPSLHIALLFLFSFFIIISLSINYFNYKIYKKHNKDFTSEWNSETRKNKIIYRFLNIAFVLFAFSTLIYILKFLDHQI